MGENVFAEWRTAAFSRRTWARIGFSPDRMLQARMFRTDRPTLPPGRELQSGAGERAGCPSTPTTATAPCVDGTWELPQLLPERYGEGEDHGTEADPPPSPLQARTLTTESTKTIGNSRGLFG